MPTKAKPKADQKVDPKDAPEVKKEPVTGLALLREPFLPNQISRLPKPTKKQTDIVRNNYQEGIRCDECGGWHHPKVVHLDYVGHAALTDRLLDCDPEWNWEPVATDEHGRPIFDNNGGMWINLTVCGVTRLGYGDAPGKNGGNAIKEVIGDSLRNAAMRFGAALDLWHKGELHVDEDAEPSDEKKNGNGNGNQTKNDKPPEVVLAEKLIGALKSASNFSMLDAIKNDTNFKVDVERLCKMNEKSGAHVKSLIETRTKELEFDGENA